MMTYGIIHAKKWAFVFTFFLFWIVILNAEFLAGQEQVATATINGTIHDASGAVIPDARITLTNLATGVRKLTRSNNAGGYVITNIPPGTYTLEVSKEGFISQTQAPFPLHVNESTTLDFTLSVGSAVQTVTVRAQGVGLQTSTAELGTVINSQSVDDLPLNGRNFSQLLTLTPGVSPISVGQNSGGSRTNAFGAFTFPSVNGQSNRSNLFLLDGVNNNETFSNTFVITPVVDDIQEFKIDSHNDQAQFGGALGGVVNVVTKSGTNQFHGTGWEFVRNSAFDARNPFFANVNPLRQNQFGANIGGPVLLPRYNGRNRTFFFGSYEGLRMHAASQALGRVPTPEELSGNLSDLGVPIYDPATTRPDPNNSGEYLRDPFPGGVIPSDRIDPNMLKFAQAVYPKPVNTGVAGANALDNSPSVHDSNEYNLRADEQLHESNTFWFRFSHISTPLINSAGMAGFTNRTGFAGYNLGAAWTHTFGSTTILQAEFGRNWAQLSPGVFFTGGNASQLISQLGFPDIVTSQFVGSRRVLLPSIGIPGFLTAGESSSSPTNTADVYEWKADLTKIYGRHSLHLGGNIDTNNNPGAVTDAFNDNFSARQTSNLEAAQGEVTGSALASFLLGVPDNAHFISQINVQRGGGTDGLYFQDQWRVTGRLSVNLGVRWDAALMSTFGRRSDLSDTVGDLNLNNGTYILQNPAPSCTATGKAPCIPGGTLPAHVMVSPNGRILDNIYDNIQPRVGLAYRLTNNTVIRASYGRFYDDWAAMVQEPGNLGGHWPTASLDLVNNLNEIYSTVPATNPFGGSLGALPGPTPFNQVAWFDDPYFKNPYSDQWNFGVQRLIGQNTVMTLNYVGSHDGRTDIAIVGNAAVTPGPGNPMSRVPYPYITPTFYDNSIGRASYNAFQFSLNKTAGHGLTYLISYTWSKAMDIGSDGWFCAEGCGIENPYDLNANKSVAGYDLTHIFTGSFVYHLPFGQGRLALGSKVGDYIVGNWSLNGILTLTSGVPYDVHAAGDIANIGSYGNYERADLVGNPNLSNPTPNGWLNPSAFAVPAPFTFGNLGRNALRGDGFTNLDLSLFREFPVSESKRFEFRFEAFNSTNTPTWGNPQNVISNINFGRIFSTRSTERELQFALKFYF